MDDFNYVIYKNLLKVNKVQNNSWFKEKFSKTKWMTIYTSNCKLRFGDMFGREYIGDAVCCIQVSTNKKHGKYKCYATDGLKLLKQAIDLKYLAGTVDGMSQFLDKYNIEY